MKEDECIRMQNKGAGTGLKPSTSAVSGHSTIKCSTQTSLLQPSHIQRCAMFFQWQGFIYLSLKPNLVESGGFQQSKNECNVGVPHSSGSEYVAD